MKITDFTNKVLIAFLSISLLCASCKRHITVSEPKIVLKLSPYENNPRNSEGSFITLKDGRILFVYTHFSGPSSGDHASAYLAARYSNDNGKTWDKESSTFIEQEGRMNIMSVSLLRLKNGDIALFYLLKNSTSDCIPMVRISKDEAKSWSDAVSCINDKEGYFVLNNDRVIQLQNNRLVMSVALHKTPEDSVFNRKGKIYSYYSDDNAQTWETSGVHVPNPDNILLQEPGLVEMRNGDIMMFMRTDMGVQYISYSVDHGVEWSPVEPSNIISPRSPASIERIPSTGDLLMIWNKNGDDHKRTPLNIAISKDDGKTWGKIKTIEDDPDGWYCYTAIHFVDNYVLLAYCAGSQSKKTYLSATNITRLNLEWIY